MHPTNSIDSLAVRRYPPAGWRELCGLWTKLLEASPYATFFLRPEWIESWLETFAPLLPAEILVFQASGEPVAAALVVRRVVRYRGFPVRSVFLNTSGEDPGDSPHLEFNNLLCLEGWERPVAAALRDDVNQQPWDEFRLNGFCPGPPLEALRAAFREAVESRTVRPIFFVNLKSLRETNTSYESALGASTRAGLRKSLRYYVGQRHALPDETVEARQRMALPHMPHVEAAADLDTALALLEELAGQHRATWAERGQAGTFASPRFLAFHRALVRRAFPTGGIQMLRVSAGQQPIGWLYNMVYAGKVYFYQWGLQYSNDRRARPGIVTLACAVEHCLAQPTLTESHFMAGGTHYKQPLATDSSRLEWVILQKDNWRMRALRLLRSCYRRWKGRAKQPPAEAEA